MKTLPGHVAILLVFIMGGCSQQESTPRTSLVENTVESAAADTMDNALVDTAAAEIVSAEEITSITDQMARLAVRLSDFVRSITDSGEDIERPSGTPGNTARAAYRVCYLLSNIEPQLKQNGADGETLAEVSEQLDKLNVIVKTFEGTDGDVRGAHQRLTLLTTYFEKLYKSEVGPLKPYSYSLDQVGGG